MCEGCGGGGLKGGSGGMLYMYVLRQYQKKSFIFDIVSCPSSLPWRRLDASNQYLYSYSHPLLIPPPLHHLIWFKPHAVTHRCCVLPSSSSIAWHIEIRPHTRRTTTPRPAPIRIINPPTQTHILRSSDRDVTRYIILQSAH